RDRFEQEGVCHAGKKDRVVERRALDAFAGLAVATCAVGGIQPFAVADIALSPYLGHAVRPILDVGSQAPYMSHQGADLIGGKAVHAFAPCKHWPTGPAFLYRGEKKVVRGELEKFR